MRRLVHVAPKPPPAPPRASVPALVVDVLAASTLPHLGYGHYAFAVARALRAAGADVRLRHLQDGGSGAPWAILVGPPGARGYPPGAVVAHCTMWESGRLSRERVDGMAGASLVVVPCEWCAIVFDACGVAPPIEVVPMGYDQAVFSPPRRRAPRPPGRPFKVGSAARAAHGGLRKGLDDAVAAFQAAFPDGRGAAMEVKVFPDDPAPEPGGGVQVLRGVWPERHLATWYRSLDVFLSMSRGEGFGLMPLQAMACGTPVVAVVAGGHAEYMREGGAVPVPYTLERSEEAMPGNGYYEGFWFRPDVDAAAQILRMLAAEDGLRAALGEAAVRAAAAFQWAVHDSRLAEVLARHGWPVTPPPPDPYSSPYGP